MRIALIEPYQDHSGIGAVTSGLYPELSEEEGFERVSIDLGKDLPVLQTTADVNYRIPKMLERISEDYDVIFVPSHTLIAGLNVEKLSSQLAVMVHDLERYPSRKDVNLVENFTRNRSIGKLSKADYVFAPSESTRLDILKYTDVGVNNTYVIGEGVETIEERENPGIEDEYFLYVGAMKKRKNVDNLLKAFAEYDGDEKLVLAGRVYSQENKQRKIQLTKELGIFDQVEFLGEVSKPELAWLYENTTGYIHPAYFEGFGRPPVEAAAYGAPVAVVKGTAPAEFLEFAYKSSPTIKGIKEAMTVLSESEENYIAETEGIADWGYVSEKVRGIVYE